MANVANLYTLNGSATSIVSGNATKRAVATTAVSEVTLIRLNSPAVLLATNPETKTRGSTRPREDILPFSFLPEHSMSSELTEEDQPDQERMSSLGLDDPLVLVSGFVASKTAGVKYLY